MGEYPQNSGVMLQTRGSHADYPVVVSLTFNGDGAHVRRVVIPRTENVSIDDTRFAWRHGHTGASRRRWSRRGISFLDSGLVDRVGLALSRWRWIGIVGGNKFDTDMTIDGHEQSL